MLAELKADKTALLAHFDTNRDGEISMEEWERAPAHGQPFIVANHEINALTNHFRLWSWVHLALMLAALFGLTFVNRIV